jgi:hypothetical protein
MCLYVHRFWFDMFTDNDEKWAEVTDMTFAGM